MKKWLCVNCESSHFEVLHDETTRAIYFKCADCGDHANAPDSFEIGVWDNLEASDGR